MMAVMMTRALFSIRPEYMKCQMIPGQDPGALDDQGVLGELIPQMDISIAHQLYSQTPLPNRRFYAEKVLAWPL